MDGDVVGCEGINLDLVEDVTGLIVQLVEGVAVMDEGGEESCDAGGDPVVSEKLLPGGDGAGGGPADARSMGDAFPHKGSSWRRRRGIGGEVCAVILGCWRGS